MITLINTATASDNSGSGITSLALPATSLTAGNTIIVSVRTGTQATINVTLGDTAGNSYSSTPQVTGGSADKVQIFYCLNAKGNAANVVTVTTDNSSSFTNIISAQYSGILGFDTSASGTGTDSTLTSGTFTTSHANELIFSAGQVSAFGSTWTDGSGTVELQSLNSILAIQDLIVSSIQTGITSFMTSSNNSSAKNISVATFYAPSNSYGGGTGRNTISIGLTIT